MGLCPGLRQVCATLSYTRTGQLLLQDWQGPLAREWSVRLTLHTATAEAAKQSSFMKHQEQEGQNTTSHYLLYSKQYLIQIMH